MSDTYTPWDGKMLALVEDSGISREVWEAWVSAHDAAVKAEATEPYSRLLFWFEKNIGSPALQGKLAEFRADRAAIRATLSSSNDTKEPTNG